MAVGVQIILYVCYGRAKLLQEDFTHVMCCLLFLFIGLFGGFTTFSTFGYETMALFRDGQPLRAVGSIALHLLLAVGGTWVGYGIIVTR